MFTRNEFVMLARAQVGKPYVLGAIAPTGDPNPKRFDCSELTRWLYFRSGNRLVDLADRQYATTTPVVGNPATGDLVFLANTPKTSARPNGIGHVAIVTAKLANGDWEVIEARGRKYGVVRTTLSYWKNRRYFAGLRRLSSFKLGATTAPNAMFRATTYNVLGTRFDYKQTWNSRRNGIVNDLKHALGAGKECRSSVVFTQETTEANRLWLQSHLGTVVQDGNRIPAYLNFEGPTLTNLMFLREAWQHDNRNRETLSFDSVHDAVMSTLTHRFSGRTVTAASAHLPVGDKYKDLRERSLDDLLSKLTAKAQSETDKSKPRAILGLDSNWHKEIHGISFEDYAAKHGFTSSRIASPKAVPGIDYIIGIGMEWRGHIVTKTGNSDHPYKTAQVTA